MAFNHTHQHRDVITHVQCHVCIRASAHSRVNHYISRDQCSNSKNGSTCTCISLKMCTCWPTYMYPASWIRVLGPTLVYFVYLNINFSYQIYVLHNGILLCPHADLAALTHRDDEYAWAGVEDPKIVVTTSHNPSSRLKQFAKASTKLRPCACVRTCVHMCILEVASSNGPC